MIGQVVSHYRIVDRLGRGGMGVVYRAEDIRLGRQVALKFLPDEVARDPLALGRFEREARAASALNHPNICTIYDFDEADGRSFLAMECLEGQTLESLIGSKPLSVGQLIDTVIEVTGGLEAAHSRGILHRDIKPGNIFLTDRGSVKLLDFGLAKHLGGSASESQGAHDASTAAEAAMLTSPGVALGTVAYMAPEQALGQDVDARADLFSLGVVMYRMATGVLPFTGRTPVAIIDAILHDQPGNASRVNSLVPGALSAMIGKLLEKDRAMRYQSASDLLADLKRLRRDREPERVNRPAQAARRKPPASSRSAGGRGANRLAVLPFENLGGEPDADYLSDGLTDTIINTLSQLPSLHVLARSTMFRFKGEGDPLEAARRMNVSAVLAGRVGQRGDVLVISVELVDARDGSQLWGARFERKVSDIFEVQDEIAREICGKLQMRLTSEQKRRLVRRPTSSAEAYQLYLRGRYHWNEWTAEGIRRSIECYQQALRLDSGYALAYAGLSDAYMSETSASALGLSPEARYSKASEAALKSLQLDEGLAEGHLALAEIKFAHEWDWAGADAEFRRALELTPNLTIALHRYSHLLVALQRWDESAAVSARCLDLDPLDPEMAVHLAFHCYYAGDHDAALAACQKALAIDGRFHEAYWFTGLACEAKGLFGDAIAAFERALALSGGLAHERACLAHALAVAGRRDDARRMLAEMERDSERRHVSAHNLALIHAGFGDRARAIEALHEARKERSSQLPYLAVEPRFRELRSEAAFLRLVRELALPL